MLYLYWNLQICSKSQFSMTIPLCKVNEDMVCHNLIELHETLGINTDCTTGILTQQQCLTSVMLLELNKQKSPQPKNEDLFIY